MNETFEFADKCEWAVDCRSMMLSRVRSVKRKSPGEIASFAPKIASKLDNHRQSGWKRRKI